MSKSKLSVLAAALSEKSGLSVEDAEKFIKQMFDVANGALQQDKIVKMKWLGTFKVQSVKDRESIDVNTGERILIEGRDKISFTPDTVLKEIVNKPFAQFETVVVNDGVDFSAIDEKFAKMEAVQSQENEKAVSEPEEVAAVSQKTASGPEVTSSIQDAAPSMQEVVSFEQEGDFAQETLLQKPEQTVIVIPGSGSVSSPSSSVLVFGDDDVEPQKSNFGDEVVVISDHQEIVAVSGNSFANSFSHSHSQSETVSNNSAPTKSLVAADNVQASVDDAQISAPLSLDQQKEEEALGATEDLSHEQVYHLEGKAAKDEVESKAGYHVVGKAEDEVEAKAENEAESLIEANVGNQPENKVEKQIESRVENQVIEETSRKLVENERLNKQDAQDENGEQDAQDEEIDEQGNRHFIIPKYLVAIACVIFVALVGGGCWFAFNYGKISAQRDHLALQLNQPKAKSATKHSAPKPTAVQDSTQLILQQKAKQDSIRLAEANKAIKLAEEAEMLKEQSKNKNASKELAEGTSKGILSETAASQKQREKLQAERAKTAAERAAAEKAAAKAKAEEALAEKLKADKAKKAKDAKSAKSAEVTKPSKYDSDPRVRTGAYRIVGVAQTVTVKSGQTLAGISKTYLGAGMECYVEAINGSSEVKAGQKLKIPKLELKKKSQVNK